MYRYVTRGAHDQAYVHREQGRDSPSASPASSTLLPVDDEHTLERLSASSSAPKDTLCSVAPYCRVAACCESSRSSWPVAILRCWVFSDEETDAARRVLRADMVVRNCPSRKRILLAYQSSHPHHHDSLHSSFTLLLPRCVASTCIRSSVQSSTCLKYRISYRSCSSYIHQITLHNDSYKASDTGHSGR
jgi:hypothetical protein